MSEAVDYATVVAAVEPTGMSVRGGLVVDRGGDAEAPPPLSDGSECRTVIVIGNVGGEMWPSFRRGEVDAPDPLDRWTRDELRPIAARLGATLVHPSDEPFQPFQQWAQRADDVWQSPIGLLIHPRFGLWHAYRGALLFGHEVAGLPMVGLSDNPCETCVDQPCLSTCPVEAFTAEGYDSQSCATHVRSAVGPDCLNSGCAARGACPVGVEFRYDSDQMRFHMEAFIGPSVAR